jgi:predicted esterase
MKTPLLMYHGTEDQVVPFTFGQKSFDALKKMGLDVTFVPVPGMPHSANERELVHVAKFINQIISP